MHKFFRPATGGSWHAYDSKVGEDGRPKARCGFSPRTDVWIVDWSDELPVNDKTCNRCLALGVNDTEPKGVSTVTVAG